MRLPFILAVLLIATPGLALANAGGTKPPGVIKGYARVVDGDTIWIGDTKIRLHGIDAPEAKQSCIMDNQPWRCGEAATEALARLVQRQAGKIGLDASQFGAHSTRSGFVTSALPAGASINRVQDVTRHKSVEVLM